MGVLVDTNILLPSVEPSHPHYATAVAAVYRLLAENTPVYFTLQNIAEFWNAATRPIKNNGLGYSISLALAEVEKIEGLLTFLPDTPAVYAEEATRCREWRVWCESARCPAGRYDEDPRSPPSADHLTEDLWEKVNLTDQNEIADRRSIRDGDHCREAARIAAMSRSRSSIV